MKLYWMEEIFSQFSKLKLIICRSDEKKNLFKLALEETNTVFKES